MMFESFQDGVRIRATQFILASYKETSHMNRRSQGILKPLAPLSDFNCTKSKQWGKSTKGFVRGSRTVYNEDDLFFKMSGGKFRQTNEIQKV